MDRRNFFKACAGGMAGIVAMILPAKARQGKEAKTLKAELVPRVCDGEPTGYVLRVTSDCTNVEPTPSEMQDVSKECRQFIDDVHNSPARSYKLTRDESAERSLRVKLFPFVDCDTGETVYLFQTLDGEYHPIDTESISSREYRRQRHKIS